MKDGEKAIGKVFLVSPIEKEKKPDPPTKMQPDQWQEIIENSIDGICILENHRLRFVNRRMEEITGYSAAELKSIGFENIIAHHD
ncbi:MAG: PAS domain S-box protein, partial [Desulfatiglandales bacterium]